ncbi:MAG: hypothetical protein ACJA2C_001270 [Marinoscillum sp.]|jgi:hypothetical protein
MFDYDKFKNEIFQIDNSSFEFYALGVFRYQYNLNPIYQAYCNQFGKQPSNVRCINEIPFLPIEFFKTHKVTSGSWNPQKIFKSSGTTMSTRSLHFVKELEFYHQVAKATFEANYGPLQNIEIAALLPSYQEQGESSLISMIDHFMLFSKPQSRYYLNEKELLRSQLSQTQNKVFLIGVSYAILDLMEESPISADHLTIMETGGMKGKRKEMIREELHEIICAKSGVQSVHSEYGMTELTSQAYFKGESFQFPNWVKVLVRDINDPLSFQSENKTGGINIIDLANIDTCSFIETKDLGQLSKDGTFQVLGRFDNSDIRGCNLLL